MQIVGCVPNFSEGTSPEFLSAIVEIFASSKDVLLLDYSMDPDHNRSVFTIIGSPNAVLDASLNACAKAASLIDMTTHKGVHPRIGAVDVVPFVPLLNISEDDTVRLSKTFGATFSTTCGVPAYYYGMAASFPERKELSALRRGEYEALAQKLPLPEWKPDEGLALFNKKNGATAVGVRIPLVAFNINFASGDLGIAKHIAATIREANDGLPSVKAIGIFLKTRGIAQVSTNITDYRQTNMKTVFDAVAALADKEGVKILETELIGLAPAKAWGVAAQDIMLARFSPKMILERRLEEFFARPEKGSSKDDKHTPQEKKFLKHLQGDILVSSTPFADMAKDAEMTEAEALLLLQKLQAQGVIKKIVAVLRHQKGGFDANAMVMWQIASERVDELGHFFARRPEISHCYERTPPFQDRFNIFTMIHLKSSEAIEQVVETLAKETGVLDYQILKSEKEFKKKSMEYF